MSPALRLLAACCRWPATDQRTHAVAAAAAGIADWDKVVQGTERHRVEPLVANGLAAAGLAVPPAIANAVAAYRSSAIRDLGETLRIAASLDSAGVPHRFLKGAPLGIAAYGNALLKRSWDIDLLVMPAQAVHAAAILSGLGYQPQMPPRPFDHAEFERWSVVSKEAIFRTPGGTTVELHWSLADHPLLLPGIDAQGPSRTIEVLDQRFVAVLPDDATIAYLAVHGTAHAWFRLKWLADFNALLNVLPDRAETIGQASELGCGKSLETALALCEYLFGDGPLPTLPLARRSLLALSLDDPSAIDAVAARVRWSIMPGIAYRRAELAIRMRGSTDRLDHPLARRWQFLYPLLRVPLWLLRRLRRRTDRS